MNLICRFDDDISPKHNIQKISSKRGNEACKILRVRRIFSFCSVDINDYLSVLKNKRYEKGS